MTRVHVTRIGALAIAATFVFSIQIASAASKAKPQGLWVGECQEVAQLVEFTPDQISAGGNLIPSVTINQNITETNLFVPGPIRFGPTIK